MKTSTKVALGILGITVIVLIVLASYKNRSQTTTGEIIKIGAALALTGDAAEWGEVAKNGAQLAVDEINEEGGIDGRSLELLIEDTHSTSKDTVSAISKLQNVNHANALLVTWLDVFQGAESALNDGVVLISPDAGIEGVNGEKVHPRVFSTWYRTGPKSELSIKHMADRGVKTLYLLAENDSYYTTALGFMKEYAAKYGIEIVGSEQPTSADSLKTIFVKIKETNPDAIFFAFYDEKKNYEFLTKYKSFAKPGVLVYSDEFARQNYTSDKYPKGSFDGVYFYAPQNPDTKFFNNYKTRFGSDPVFGASTAYDSVYMLAEILKKNPTDVDGFMRSRTFDTVSYGQVKFDTIGGVTSKENYFEIKQIVNGQVK